MTQPVLRKRRCAIYTRKSSEEGLEQEFNALDAQRDAGLAFVASQKSEGWVALPDRYDDGGISGGTLERPALQRLLRAVEAGLVDVIVVYKIDRLSRSLMDFARLVETFERHHVTFVSVTQQFNTTTSMGRLTLNILLSFAQFEREVIGERIRDKFQASRQRGLWMGGWPPLGYRVESRRLLVVATEAALVQRVFTRFAETGSVPTVVKELRAAGEVTKARPFSDGRVRGGLPWTKGAVYKLLSNRLYCGDAVHKGVAYPGEHQAIVGERLWQRVHAVLAEPARTRAGANRARVPMLLRGILYGPKGRPMSPSHTRRRGRVYRYYVTREAIEDGYASCPIRSVPADDVEAAVLAQVHQLLITPEMIARVWVHARHGAEGITERQVTSLIGGFGALWNELFPAEQTRIVQLLVERVDLHEDGIEVRLRAEGLASLLGELRQAPHPKQAA